MKLSAVSRLLSHSDKYRKKTRPARDLSEPNTRRLLRLWVSGRIQLSLEARHVVEAVNPNQL